MVISRLEMAECECMAIAFRPMFRRGASKPDAAAVTGAAESECDVSAPGAIDPETSEPDTWASDAPDSTDEDGEWLAYELHPWALEDRVMLRQLLIADEIVHSWQGTTLLVHFSLEAEVDILIDDVEKADSQQIDIEDDLTAFEIMEWPQELRSELSEHLTQARVAHMIDDTGDGCDLLVREVDEERAELVIDDLLAREEEADLDELDGLELNDLLSVLFVACDRLQRNPHDPNGVLGAVNGARRLSRVRTPFGFSNADWRSLRRAVQTLLQFLEDDDTSEEELREQAHRLRNVLKMLV